MQGGDILKLKTMQIDDNKNYIYLFIDLVDVLKTIYNIKIYFMNNISFSLILSSRRSALPLRSGRSKKWHLRKELYMGNFLSKDQKGSNFSDTYV